jgi:transcriptional regulator with XRE-family HTH domain
MTKKEQIELSDKVIIYRAKNDLSQTEFAKRCKLSTLTVKNVEKCKASPTALTLQKIKNVLGEE